MKNKKIIILSSVIIGVLVVVLGFSYALFTFDRSGRTSELILGDIWMRYRDTNQLVLNNAMPSDGIDVLKTYEYTKYIYNENMTDDEMSACVEYFQGYSFDDDETSETYCAGTGTLNGKTIHEYGNVSGYLEYLEEQLIDNNIFVVEDVIPSKRIIYTNLEYNYEATEEEINKCTQIYVYEEFDEGTTRESYCRGEGTKNGETLIESLKNINNLDYYDLTNFSPYIATNIVKPVVNMSYFEFTIDGKNTYEEKDIIYDIRLSYGDNHDTRTTRIKDENLQFTLIEVDEDGNMIDVLLNKQKYFDLSDKRIWVDTVPANSNTEVNKTYRLYMYIAGDTVIGNVEQDYTMEEWNDVFASIKVNVSGDFNDKELDATDESCFEGEAEKKYKYNENMTDDEMSACVEYFLDSYYMNEEDARSFCQGTGTLYGLTIRERYSNIENAYVAPDEYETLSQIGAIQFDSYGDFIITDYDENCGGTLIFPEMINGYKVSKLSSGWRVLNLHNKGLINVIFSANITHIGYNIFYGNPLTNVFIPSSVSHLSCDTFEYDVNIVYEDEDLVCTVDGGNG